MRSHRWRSLSDLLLPLRRSKKPPPERSDSWLVDSSWLTEWQALIDAKRFADAAAVVRERLGPVERTYGPTSQEMSNCLILLTLSLALAGQTSDSEYRALLSRAIELDGQIDSPDHPIVAMHLEHLACSFMKLKEYGSAEPHLRRCISIWENRTGGDSIKVAMCLLHLAEVRLRLDDELEAQGLIERAVTILERDPKSKRQDLIGPLGTLAAIARHRRDTRQAMHCCSRILLIQEDTLGPESSDLAVNRAMFALWLRELPGADLGMLRTWYAKSIETMAKKPPGEFQECAQRWKAAHGFVEEH